MIEPSTPLPPLFVARLARILPPERLASALDSFAATKPTCLRINRLKADPATVARELTEQGFELEPVPWCPDAWWIPAHQRRALTDTTAFHQGRVYLQSPASLLAPLALAPQAGETVLDLAAAPGGKTLHLAALMGDQGQLAAVEAVRDRFFRLRANLDKHGANPVRTYLMDGRLVGRKTPGRFDRILLDAPCSSEARFRCQTPASWAHWSPNKIREAAHKQRGLLAAAVQALKPGGRLLYCTCSFAPEENELVLDRQLRRSGASLRLEPLEMALPDSQSGLTSWEGKALHPDLGHCRRILPDARMDGFFMGLARKVEDE